MNKKDQLGYDILEKYNFEISEIKRRLNSIKEGNIFGVGFQGSKSDGSLPTNIMKVEKLIADLLNKIQYGLDSDMEKMAEAVNRAFNKE